MFEGRAGKALQALLAELGGPPVRILEPGEFPEPGDVQKGTLVATLVPEDAAELAVLALQEAGLQDVQPLPVGSGDTLVVGLGPASKPRALREPTPRRPISSTGARKPGPASRSPTPDRSRRLVAGASSRDLDIFRIARALADGEHALQERALVVQRGRVHIPTVPALLAFGTRPWVFLPGACVLATTADDAQRFAHPIADLPTAVAAWPAFSDVPTEWAELLVQLAILGRDWSEDVEAVPITLDLDGKHLTLRFPGTAHNPELIDLLVPQGLQAAPLHRLQVLTGRRLRPTSQDGTVRLRVPVPEVSVPPTRRGRYMSRFDRQDIVVAHLTEHGPKTTRELMADLDWTRSTLRTTLAALVAEGRVETSAEGRQAPGQRYRVRR